MPPESAPRKRRRRERVEGTAFMDVAREAFVRYVALRKWREVDGARTTSGLEWNEAVQSVARFGERGRYEALWVARWLQDVPPAVHANDAGVLFAAIERAITHALADEETERRARGDGPIDDDPEYGRFIGNALGSLAREAGAQLETQPDRWDRLGTRGASAHDAGPGT